MIEKTKNILSIILILLILFSLIYAVIAWIVSKFEEVDIISADEVQLYLIQSNLVTDYNVYYYMDECLNNIVKSARLKEYDKLYELYLTDYKDVYTKEDVYIKLKEFGADNLQYELQRVYMAQDLYILEYELNGKINYMFISNSNSKRASYNFAIIK